MRKRKYGRDGGELKEGGMKEKRGWREKEKRKRRGKEGDKYSKR